MIFEFADEVFRDADTPLLLAMFALVAKGRHKLVVATTPSPHFETWLATLDEWSREGCTKVVDDSTRLQASEPSYHAISVVRAHAAMWTVTPPLLPLEDAYDLMHRPYRLLLEGIGDVKFIFAMSTAEERTFLKAMHAQEWLEVETCGGISAVARRAQDLRGQQTRIRCSALSDSDAPKPGWPSAAARDVEEACRDRIHYYGLARRAIENYLPLATLERWSNSGRPPNEVSRRTQLVRAFARMTVTQRQHFHMKDGFSVNHPDDAGELYENVAPEIRDRLNDGFGSQIADRFERFVREAELRADGGWAELRPFIEGLVERLR